MDHLAHLVESAPSDASALAAVRLASHSPLQRADLLGRDEVLRRPDIVRYLLERGARAKHAIRRVCDMFPEASNALRAKLEVTMHYLCVVEFQARALRLQHGAASSDTPCGAPTASGPRRTGQRTMAAGRPSTYRGAHPYRRSPLAWGARMMRGTYRPGGAGCFLLPSLNSVCIQLLCRALDGAGIVSDRSHRRL